jgi:hypothetical protein
VQIYLKTRGHLLSVASSVGTLFSTVLFTVDLEGIRSYFNVGIFSKHQFPLELALFVLPILSAYILLYLLNRLLILVYGAEDLQDRRRKLLISLVDAYIFQRAVFYRADDLLDEYAWSGIKPFWRHK